MTSVPKDRIAELRQELRNVRTQRRRKEILRELNALRNRETLDPPLEYARPKHRSLRQLDHRGLGWR